MYIFVDFSSVNGKEFCMTIGLKTVVQFWTFSGFGWAIFNVQNLSLEIFLGKKDDHVKPFVNWFSWTFDVYLVILRGLIKSTSKSECERALSASLFNST